MKYYSQAGQDKWVCEQLNSLKGGFFVEIGAYDGVESSNTFCLESLMGWKGICIEPNISAFQKLCKNRKSINVCLAVRGYGGMCGFVSDKVLSDSGTTPCDTLHNILLKNRAPRKIDYISLDIEGLEYEVLSGFPFDQWDTNLWTIEHNLYCAGPENKEKIYKVMIANGFERVAEDILADGKLPFEDWYKKVKKTS